jgi:iron complex transport system substrate-binding protein
VVGGLTDIDVRKVEALHPDVILTCTGLQSSLRKKFSAEGYKVVHMDEAGLKEVYTKILDLGKAIGRERNAETLVDSIRTGLKSVVAKYAGKPKVKVYYEINYAYKCVPGKDSYITELMKMVGAEPVFSDRAGIAPSVSWEEIVEANPDVILVPLWENAGGPLLLRRLGRLRYNDAL